MNEDQVSGVLVGIKCVVEESKKWRELVAEYTANRQTKEAAVAAAIATAFVDLGERMTSQLKKYAP